MADKPDESARPALPKVSRTATGPTPIVRSTTESTAVTIPPKPPAPPRPPQARAMPPRPPTPPPVAIEEERTDTAQIPHRAPARLETSPPVVIHDAPRSAFDASAQPYIAQLREVMLEVEFGKAAREWLEVARMALRALGAMAETPQVAGALKQLATTVDAVVAKSKPLTRDDRSRIVQSYEGLVAHDPKSLETDVERGSREPVIVRALFAQVERLEWPAIDKLLTAGLDRIDIVATATAKDISDLTGIRLDLAAGVVAQFVAYRDDERAVLASPDPAADRKQLALLLDKTRALDDEYRAAAAQWTDEARSRKRLTKRRRDAAFQRVRIVLARLGEVGLLAELDRQPFADRVTGVGRFLGASGPLT